MYQGNIKLGRDRVVFRSELREKEKEIRLPSMNEVGLELVCL